MSLSERVTISLLLPGLTFLREYAQRHGLGSRSAAFHAAIDEQVAALDRALLTPPRAALVPAARTPDG